MVLLIKNSSYGICTCLLILIALSVCNSSAEIPVRRKYTSKKAMIELRTPQSTLVSFDTKHKDIEAFSLAWGWCNYLNLDKGELIRRRLWEFDCKMRSVLMFVGDRVDRINVERNGKVTRNGNLYGLAVSSKDDLAVANSGDVKYLEIHAIDTEICSEIIAKFPNVELLSFQCFDTQHLPLLIKALKIKYVDIGFALSTPFKTALREAGFEVDEVDNQVAQMEKVILDSLQDSFLTNLRVHSVDRVGLAKALRSDTLTSIWITESEEVKVQWVIDTFSGKTVAKLRTLILPGSVPISGEFASLLAQSQTLRHFRGDLRCRPLSTHFPKLQSLAITDFYSKLLTERTAFPSVEYICIACKEASITGENASRNFPNAIYFSFPGKLPLHGKIKSLRTGKVRYENQEEVSEFTNIDELLTVFFTTENYSKGLCEHLSFERVYVRKGLNNIYNPIWPPGHSCDPWDNYDVLLSEIMAKNGDAILSFTGYGIPFKKKIDICNFFPFSEQPKDRRYDDKIPILKMGYLEHCGLPYTEWQYYEDPMEEEVYLIKMIEKGDLFEKAKK